MIKALSTTLLLFLYAQLSYASKLFDEGLQALLDGNYAEAYCRWKPIAAQGDVDAQYNLAWLYANGNGMTVDVGKALYWWEKAAETGHADAEFAMGLAYTTGEGIKRDMQAAIAWFIKAAQHGSDDAREIIQRLSTNDAYQLVQNFPEVLEFPWFGDTGSIQTDRANIRAGAGTSHKIVGVKNRGDEVRMVYERGSWIMIVYDSEEKGKNQIGWVFKKLVKKTAS